MQNQDLFQNDSPQVEIPKEIQFQQQTLQLIDQLKSVCANYGLGNDANEFKIITQVFLYKLLNDKFFYEIKQLDESFANNPNWELAYSQLSDDDQEMLMLQLNENIAKLDRKHTLSELNNAQNDANFAQRFDDTLLEIAQLNHEIFAVQTEGGAKIQLFDKISECITDPSKRDAFCKAIINKLITFSFEEMFSHEQKFDFYATVFEYLIKDYNSNSGGKYAEYYTPHAVARIIANILIPKAQQGQILSATCYDPSAGSGTLLMNIAHTIGEENCSIYTQDISQKSSNLLRLNLILNNLVDSIQNVVQGNTILHPFHQDKGNLKQFDYIVSNPPFKLDFSDFRDDLDTPKNKPRFFAGIPTVPKKDKDKMDIYLLFIQHIISSLKPNGKSAIVLPTGFFTAQGGIEQKIKQHLVKNKMLAGVISMPSNIFAKTSTNVSILFIDASNKNDVVLIDASNLGEKIKDGKNQKTVLTDIEEQKIIDTFNQKQAIEDFSVVVSYEQIAEKNYSLSAGQYFDVKVEYESLTPEAFTTKMQGFSERLDTLFAESHQLENEIKDQLKNLKY